MTKKMPLKTSVAELGLLVEEFKSALREEKFQADLKKRSAQAILGPPIENQKSPDVFVIMPFKKELKPVYEDHIKAVARQIKCSVGTAKDILPHAKILDAIWSGINAAQIVIADCTGGNTNVMYEIGLAHALGKDTILISQSVGDVPSDISNVKVIVYDFTPRGMREFEEVLKQSIVYLRGRRGRSKATMGNGNAY